MRTTPPTIRPIKHSSHADDCAWVDHVRWQPQTLYNSTQLQEGLDTDLNVYTIGIVWNMCDWPLYHIYYGDSSTRSGSIGANQKSQMEVRLDGPGTVTFYWKVSSLENYHWLEVYLDGVRQDRISGEVGWQQKSYNVSGAGTHSLMWQYIKDNRTADGSDRGWVDYLQWTPGAGGASTGWEEITYTYDPAGRRIAKDVDGVVTKYLYDGDQCIAEYDGDDTLLRKFIHGPSIDEPICMIEAAGGYAGTYYYHYDALGSVVALSDADGETVQVYEYDVYGQPAAADPGHPNPFAFTGRRFDPETGLYYYRARYYNPTIGRFLQTDPIGYEDGINWYRYCNNNPANWADPTGTQTSPAYSFSQADGCLVFTADGKSHYFKDGIDDWIRWAEAGGLWWDGDTQTLHRVFPEGWEKGQAGWLLAGAGGEEDQRWWFWRIKALTWLSPQVASLVGGLEKAMLDRGLSLVLLRSTRNRYDSGIVEWNSHQTEIYDRTDDSSPNWYTVHPLAMLAHELAHARDDAAGGFSRGRKGREGAFAEVYAMRYENYIRKALWLYDPGQAFLYPRPGYLPKHADIHPNVNTAWRYYDPRELKY